MWSDFPFLFLPHPILFLKPPVQIYGIEGRYATALYSAASKQNKLEQVEKELLRVAVSSFSVYYLLSFHHRFFPYLAMFP